LISSSDFVFKGQQDLIGGNIYASADSQILGDHVVKKLQKENEELKEEIQEAR